MAKLEQSGSRILNAWSVILTFSIIIIFILQKLKTELKNLEHSSHTIALSIGTIFTTIFNYFCKQKNADISKIKGALVLKDICVCTYVPNFKFLA